MSIYSVFFYSGPPWFGLTECVEDPSGDQGSLVVDAVVANVRRLVKEIRGFIDGEVVSLNEVDAGEEVDEEERSGEEEGERQMELGDGLRQGGQVRKAIGQKKQREVRDGDESENQQHDGDDHHWYEHAWGWEWKGRRW